jgi:hypothetical protein
MGQRGNLKGNKNALNWVKNVSIIFKIWGNTAKGHEGNVSTKSYIRKEDKTKLEVLHSLTSKYITELEWSKLVILNMFS